MLGSSWESVLSVQIWITKSGPAAPLATSRPSRFILSTTRPTRAWHLVLIVGLGLSLAPWIVAAEAHTSKSGSHGEVCVQSKHLKNSPEAARGDQAEAPTDLIVVQAPEVRPGPLSKRFPQGSHLVRLAPSDPTPHSLTPDFFTAADPRISLDGTHVLFAAQRTADSSWQIWEINVDGSDVRQITRCPGDCLKAAYLPRGQIVYTSLAEGPVWDDRDGVLWWVDIPAGRVHAFNPRHGTDTAYDIGRPVGSVALRADRTLLVAAQDAFVVLDPATGGLETLLPWPPEAHPGMANDGKCDPRGRFLIGRLPACP